MIDPVIERQYDDCRKLMDLWRKYHDYFKVGVAGKDITPEREHEFITIKSHIAMLHDTFMDCLEHDQNIGQNILSIVTRSITLKHIHRMSTAEIKKIELEWHESYLLLNETIGVIEDKRNRFSEVTPSEYYRKLYTQKATKAVRDFLTGWVFKSIVILIVVMVLIFAAIQFELLNRIYETGWGKNLVLKFENLIRVAYKDYPFREVTPAVFERMDKTSSSQLGTIQDPAAQSKPQYGPPVGIQRVANMLQGSPNDFSQDLKQHADCRAEVWSSGGQYGGRPLVLWLYRMPLTKSAKEIQAKYELWKAEPGGTRAREWIFFRRSNVIGIGFGGDDIGVTRSYVHDQYMHIRRKK